MLGSVFVFWRRVPASNERLEQTAVVYATTTAEARDILRDELGRIAETETSPGEASASFIWGAGDWDIAETTLDGPKVISLSSSR